MRMMNACMTASGFFSSLVSSVRILWAAARSTFLQCNYTLDNDNDGIINKQWHTHTYSHIREMIAAQFRSNGE